jgi:hypothetical protein
MRTAAVHAVHPELLTAGAEGATLIGALSTSVLLRVFSWLPNGDLCRVMECCRLWHDLGRHSFSWKDRATGSVSIAEVKAWMREVAQSRVLERSGFRQISGLCQVGTAEDAVPIVAMWRRVVQLVALNETKIVVTRAGGQSGGLQYVKFSAAAPQKK